MLGRYGNGRVYPLGIVAQADSELEWYSVRTGVSPSQLEQT